MATLNFVSEAFRLSIGALAELVVPVETIFVAYKRASASGFVDPRDLLSGDLDCVVVRFLIWSQMRAHEGGIAHFGVGGDAHVSAYAGERFARAMDRRCAACIRSEVSIICCAYKSAMHECRMAFGQL